MNPDERTDIAQSFADLSYDVQQTRALAVVSVVLSLLTFTVVVISIALKAMR